MKRGDIVTIALSGDYGKPCPGLIIQSDIFAEMNSVTILPLTTHLIDAPLFRVAVKPTDDNGLIHISHVMVDKLVTTPRDKIRQVIGSLENKTMIEIERALALFIGIA